VQVSEPEGPYTTVQGEQPGWHAPGAWRAWAVQAALGVALGLLLVGGVFLAEWATGWLLVLAVAPPAAAIAALLGGAARALGVAALEETIFRGVLLGYLRRPIGTPAAVAVSALAFALVHAWNANATPLALVNLAVAGVLFGLAYLVARGPTPAFAAEEAAARGLPALAYAIARGLALPIALHAAWNFFEGSVFGFPVSGSSRPSLLAVDVAGPELVTGGAFGPEGGLLGLGATLLTALVLWLLRGWVPRAPAGIQAQRDG
jgi:membrane protease YdiL (CAAX protease family)